MMTESVIRIQVLQAIPVKYYYRFNERKKLWKTVI